MTALASRRQPSGSRKATEFWTDVPFTKAPTTSTGDLELSGYASTWGMDRDDEMVAATAFDKSLGSYLSKNPMLLWQHNMDWPIGQVTSGKTDDNGLFITARIPDPGPNAADWQKGAYTAIKTGVVRTFSIGGYMYRDVKSGSDGPVFVINEVDLFEISCVSIPANADSIYEAAVKAVKGLPQKMGSKAHEQMTQLLGAEPLTDPELAGMTEEERVKRYELLADMFKRVYDLDPLPMDSWHKVVDAREKGVDLLRVGQAASAVARMIYEPESVSEEAKAGRAISATNKTHLETALDHHAKLEQKMIDCAESMKAAAQSHVDAMKEIKTVLGIKDEQDQQDAADLEEGDDNAADAPEKDASVPDSKAADVDAKQLVSNLFARLRDAGVTRFGAADPDDRVMVFVDDVDVDQGFVVYCVWGTDSDDYYRVPFTRADDGSVTLSAATSPVEPVTDYVPKALAHEAAKDVSADADTADKPEKDES